MSTYINYGVSADIAEYLENRKIPSTTFRATSKELLISTYGLDEKLVIEVKKSIQRQPIEDDTLQLLLERSNYTCCLCKGQKGKSYVIHHIEEYSISQDNNYYNLAVLCPVCHDTAHTKGGLTNSISAEQITKTKDKWEAQVEKQNMEAASRSGMVTEIDFINIPRITELALNLLHVIPETSVTDRLLTENIITNTGELNLDGLKSWSNGKHYFDFILSGRVKYHFFEIFKQLLPLLDFKNLDDLLNIQSLKSSSIIGTYCFYVGGLYGKSVEIPITEESETTHLYFKRRKLFVEWIIDPKFITSSSAVSRFGTRTTYLMYGVIRDVKEIELNGKVYLHIDIRPYIAGMPTKTVNRTPNVYWDNYQPDDFELETDDD
jgi:hypothetical protein